MSKIFRRLGKTGLVFQLDGEGTSGCYHFTVLLLAPTTFVKISRAHALVVLSLTVTLEKLRVPRSLEPETMLLVLSRGGKKSVLSQEHFIAVSILQIDVND
jgi:hypothetical protein